MATPQRRTIVFDVRALTTSSDVATIDTLARLALLMRRHGLEILLRGASQELVELLAFMGLLDVLRVEPRGQPEEREQRVGIEEERELDDRPG
jgi:anti-anti-sigma regulatory factor